jgi:hypothetical protein
LSGTSVVVGKGLLEQRGDAVNGAVERGDDEGEENDNVDLVDEGRHGAEGEEEDKGPHEDAREELVLPRNQRVLDALARAGGRLKGREARLHLERDAIASYTAPPCMSAMALALLGAAATTARSSGNRD